MNIVNWPVWTTVHVDIPVSQTHPRVRPSLVVGSHLYKRPSLRRWHVTALHHENPPTLQPHSEIKHTSMPEIVTYIKIYQDCVDDHTTVDHPSQPCLKPIKQKSVNSLYLYQINRLIQYWSHLPSIYSLIHVLYSLPPVLRYLFNIKSVFICLLVWYKTIHALY